MIKVLHVETPNFTAQATFHKVNGKWKCTKSTPSVDWMEVADISIVRIWLERNGYKFEWRQAEA